MTFIDFKGRKTLITRKALSFTDPNANSRILKENLNRRITYPEIITTVSIIFQPFLKYDSPWKINPFARIFKTPSPINMQVNTKLVLSINLLKVPTESLSA